MLAGDYLICVTRSSDFWITWSLVSEGQTHVTVDLQQLLNGRWVHQRRRHPGDDLEHENSKCQPPAKTENWS